MKADFASRFALPLVVTTVVGCGSPRTATSIKSADLAAPAQSADATSQRCDGARRAVASLDSPLRITAYVSSGTPELDRASAEVRAALERLKASGPRVDYAIVNTLEADGASRARAAGMLDLRNTETGDDRADRFMGLTFEYGSERDKIALFPVERISSFEFEVLKRVALLRARALRSKHRLGVLTGHGEIGFAGANLTPPTKEQPPTLQGIAATYSPHVELVDVDLGRSSSIDETLEGLIITQPTTDIPEEHLRRVDEFVIKGKTLVVIASAVNLKAGDTSMFASLSTHGLEKLLAGYGIEMRKDVVEEFGHPYKVALETQNGRHDAIFPPILDVENEGRFPSARPFLDTEFSGFGSLKRITFPYASSLVLHPDRQSLVPAEGFRILARSSPAAMHQRGEDADVGVFRHWAAKGPFKQYDVAAIVEGKLTSAFEGATPGTPTPRNSRVLVLASSLLLANPFVHVNRTTNRDPVLDQLAQAYAADLVPIFVAKELFDWVWMDPSFGTCACSPKPPAR